MRLCVEFSGCLSIANQPWVDMLPEVTQETHLTCTANRSIAPNMKAITALIASLALVCCSNASDLKIGTVNVQRLFKEYYRAEDVSRDLETRRQNISKELSDLRLDGDRLLKEAHDLQASAEDTALSPAAKEEKKRDFNLKLEDLRAFQQRFDQTQQEREAEFQNSLQQAQKRLTLEISDATRGIGEKEGFNLVLKIDKTDTDLGEIVFTRNVPDITDKVLALLNATKPTTNAAPGKLQP